MRETLKEALAQGDPQKVAALIEAGADIHYLDESGYDALIDAVHGRDVLRDARLIDLLNLLIARGVSLTGMSAYGESGVRVLSNIGRFDAVKLLLDAGSDPNNLEFTPLIEAVAFGALIDVETVVARGVDLEQTERWERTAWLVAIQTGDIAKTKFLLERGSRVDVRGRCGKPPLFYAIVNHHASMLRWLLKIGVEVDQTDDFGGTPLIKAAEYDNLEAVDILLQAGVDLHQKNYQGSALSNADGLAVALRLLEAGADPLELSSKARRAILRYSNQDDENLFSASSQEFSEYRSRRFGSQNPERMKNPFWESMVRSGMTAYGAEVQMGVERKYGAAHEPVWCAERYGQSMTFLGDGRIVQVGGEHEDYGDMNFCIYNDVFVHDPDGALTIYGYPESVFPPTDFHTATLIGDYVYLIGSLGYLGARRYGETPVYRLNTQTFHIEPLKTKKCNPGWIYNHRAVLLTGHEIRVTGGQVVTSMGGREDHSENAAVYLLDIETLVWRVENDREA